MSKKIQDIIENMTNVNKVCGLVCFPVLNLSSLDLEEFDSFDFYGDNQLDGVNSKGFYRISTDVIENVIREIRSNSNSSIITCYNNAIREGKCPKKISALLKHTVSATQPDALVTALLNYYGAPTTLNLKGIKDIDMEFPVDGEEIQNIDAPLDKIIISIDALNEGQEFLTFEDAEIEDNSFSFESLYSSTMTYLTKIFTQSPFNELSNEEQDAICSKIRDQLALSFLVRRYICSDSDFDARNLGIILDHKNKDVNIINFDYEYAFRYNYSQFRLRTIEDMLANAPEVYNKFIDLSKQLYQNLYDEKILMGSERAKLCARLNSNDKQLLDLYSNLENILNIVSRYEQEIGTTNDKVK